MYNILTSQIRCRLLCTSFLSFKKVRFLILQFKIRHFSTSIAGFNKNVEGDKKRSEGIKICHLSSKNRTLRNPKDKHPSWLGISQSTLGNSTGTGKKFPESSLNFFLKYQNLFLEKYKYSSICKGIQ